MTLYAQVSDVVSVGMQANVVARLQPSQQQACLADASSEGDAHFRGRWGYDNVPLLAWDPVITGAVARVAAYRMVLVAGINVDSADYKLAEKLYASGRETFDMIQRQQLHPIVTLANGQLPGQQQPRVISFSVINLATGAKAARRGW